MNWKPIAAVLIATAISVTTANAQTCASLSAALEALASSCTAMTRGDLCHDGQIYPFEGMSNFHVETLALGEIQANYPDVAAGRFVSLALIGGLDVQPVIEPSAETLPERVPVSVVVTGTQANVRAQPARSGDPVAKLDDGTLLNATGKSRSGTWIRVQLPDQPMQPAWIIRDLLQTDYDLSVLAVVSGDDPLPEYPEFTPMQAFSLSGGSPCAGVLAQSGDDLAQLEVNGVDLQFNQATAFLQNTGAALTIHVLEGVVQVQAEGTTTISIAGSFVSVPLDGSGQPSGAPQSASPDDPAALGRFNGSYFQRVISAPTVASAQAIENALVTPLSGRWQIVYPPPYTYKSVEPNDCGELTVKQHNPIVEITVSDDGSSLSTFNKDLTLGTGVRARPGLYELTDFKFQVLSPTEMTATYDTNPLEACTSIITIDAHWLGP